MAIKLNMNTLACGAHAKKMPNGQDPTVSRLYRISGVDWLLAEKDYFSSATFLMLVDQARERAPPSRKGNFLVENKPNNKMYRQLKRYVHLESPKGGSLLAASDLLEMKLEKILIVASSDYLYSPAQSFGRTLSSSQLQSGLRTSDGNGNMCTKSGEHGPIGCNNSRIERQLAK